jgi:regulator of protease activity HflC (stomatin/prohibitin superfamily)
MDPLLIAILVMVFLSGSVVLLSLHILKEGHVMVVERLGGFYKIIEKPGSYFLFPMFDRAIEIVDIRKQTKSIQIRDEENLSIDSIDVEYTFQIVDPKLFVYASVNSLKTFETIVKDTWIKYRVLGLGQIDELSEIANNLGIQLMEISIL